MDSSDHTIITIDDQPQYPWPGLLTPREDHPFIPCDFKPPVTPCSSPDLKWKSPVVIPSSSRIDPVFMINGNNLSTPRHLGGQRLGGNNLSTPRHLDGQKLGGTNLATPNTWKPPIINKSFSGVDPVFTII